ncbi:hypothetical protein C7974DRAFT_396049 [Boeremia exigua]|uniref:uncharacterized protein n=1 Tax=Boeremia exigua TaxID=749465 RepID=UPI001E8CAB36|nr:uncharacterized protein C7974DRAFT_396049 [Boeremia exigua]KAH6625413.1 hypothetical protein C7974DRAFT_396049 [Boeremia exigua]
MLNSALITAYKFRLVLASIPVVLQVTYLAYPALRQRASRRPRHDESPLADPFQRREAKKQRPTPTNISHALRCRRGLDCEMCKSRRHRAIC